MGTWESNLARFLQETRQRDTPPPPDYLISEGRISVMDDHDSMSSTAGNQSFEREEDPLTALKVKIHVVAVVGAILGGGSILAMVLVGDRQPELLPVWNAGLAGLVSSAVMLALATGLAAGRVSLGQHIKAERRIIRRLDDLSQRQDRIALRLGNELERRRAN